jgi:transcriptional regulator with XRE-family HTH domain
MKNKVIQKAIDICGTQSKLAEDSGVSQATIHKLLTGKSKDMRGKTASGLSKATGIPISDFLTQ